MYELMHARGDTYYIDCPAKIGIQLRNKFLMAKPCAVRDVDDSGVPPELADRVLGLCGEGRTFEEVLAGVFALYDLSMDFTQYVLVGSTVRSYLAYLHGYTGRGRWMWCLRRTGCCGGLRDLRRGEQEKRELIRRATG